MLYTGLTYICQWMLLHIVVVICGNCKEKQLHVKEYMGHYGCNSFIKLLFGGGGGVSNSFIFLQ